MSEAPVIAAEQLVSTLARKFAIDVNTGTALSPVWTRVRAITDMSPSIDSNLEDDSDYDSDGWGSQTKTGMSWSLEMTLARKKGVTSKNYDAGQEELRLASDEFGVDGTVQVRWYDREGGPEAYSGYGTVTWEPQGGSPTDLDSVKCTVNGQGKRTTITNPITPAPDEG